MPRLLTFVVLSAVIAASLATTRALAIPISGRICKYTNPGLLTDLGIDFITSGSCAKVAAMARQLHMHTVPRTTLYGEPRCAFKTSLSSNVGVGVIVFETRSSESHGSPCVFARHWRGYTRVSIVYATAAALTVGH
jgi:hypothetical protein